MTSHNAAQLRKRFVDKLLQRNMQTEKRTDEFPEWQVALALDIKCIRQYMCTCGPWETGHSAQKPWVYVGDGDTGQVGDVRQGEGGGNRNAETDGIIRAVITTPDWTVCILMTPLECTADTTAVPGKKIDTPDRQIW